jgi:flagellar hook assembly protein FlgD
MTIKCKDGKVFSYNIKDVSKITFSRTLNVEDREMIMSAIRTFTLLQNYPNPANPSTTIEYRIPEAGYVEINIYSIAGELVKTLESRFKNAGTYQINWDSKNIFGQNSASGIYIYQVKFNESILTKKLIIMK